jgi:signal transduction histidine kinase
MLINATVSHELRNPLNSLIAQNIEKKALYRELMKQVEKCEMGEVTKQVMTGILNKLTKGCKVQESSANLMEFLVHDLLDFAQIRAGKFRKNIKKFNIKEAID